MVRKLILANIFLLFAINFNVCYANKASVENNAVIARKFFEAIVNEKNFDTASLYIGNWYTEHDPQGMDGPSGLKSYIDFLRENYPNSHVDIKRMIADRDYVIFHVHSILVPGTRGQAIVDIFRLDHGKVVEHWDVTQDVPEKSNNPNGMF